MTSSTCGVYQAESVRSHRRGKLCVIVVLHNVIFYMAASWLTLGCSFFNNGLQWRLPLALQVSFPSGSNNNSLADINSSCLA